MRFVLTYFDTALNRRVKYLCGASFISEDEAQGEFDKICKEKKSLESSHTFHRYSSRTKWAMEAIKDGKKKLIRTLSCESALQNIEAKTEK